MELVTVGSVSQPSNIQSLRHCVNKCNCLFFKVTQKSYIYINVFQMLRIHCSFMSLLKSMYLQIHNTNLEKQNLGEIWLSLYHCIGLLVLVYEFSFIKLSQWGKFPLYTVSIPASVCTRRAVIFLAFLYEEWFPALIVGR